MKQINWTRVLTVLLVVLAAYAVLYVTASVLLHFAHALLILVLGAMVAYVLTPLVNRLETIFRQRWIAIVAAYVVVAAVLISIAVLLFTPFIEQSRSLVDNLQTPTSGSLRTIERFQTSTLTLQRALASQQHQYARGGVGVPNSDSAHVTQLIATLQRELVDVKNGKISGTSHVPVKPHSTSGRLPSSPEPQTDVPVSYVRPLQRELDSVSTHYATAIQISDFVDVTNFNAAYTVSKRLHSDTKRLFGVMSTTPILVIRSQTWLDQHQIDVDVHSKFGEVARQVSDQGTSILDNAVTIVSATANILLNITLILIVAFYLLSDGGSIIHGSINLIPQTYREQVWYFVQSLDSVLGGYVRGQLFLSALAGILGGGGAAALDVPYPLLIGVVTFLLESIPVIGPIVALVPPIAISLFFMPVVTTLILLVWNIVFQQLVTNIIGPRVLGMAVGIHPLEAMMAVLVGYPIGGFLGAFLAVPIAGIVHIVLRELYAYFVHGRALPTATSRVEVATAEEQPSPAKRAAG